MRVVPVVFRKYVLSLRNVENDRSLVHVVNFSQEELTKW